MECVSQWVEEEGNAFGGESSWPYNGPKSDACSKLEEGVAIISDVQVRRHSEIKQFCNARDIHVACMRRVVISICGIPDLATDGLSHAYVNQKLERHLEQRT